MNGLTQNAAAMTRDPLQEQKAEIWQMLAELPHHDQVNVAIFAFEKVYQSIKESQIHLRKTIEESRIEYQGIEEQKAIFVKFASRLTEEYGREERFENNH